MARKVGLQYVMKCLNIFLRQVHLGRLYLPSVSDISSEEESEEERTLRWVVALPPIPQPLDLSSHNRKREREEEEEEENGVFLKSEECIFGGIGGKKAFLKRQETGVRGIGGSFESFAGSPSGDQNQKSSRVSEKQANVAVSEQRAGESSVEEICTVFLEVDVKKEYTESDDSFNDRSQQIQRGGFWGEEGEKLLQSSPTESWESLSPRLQIDLGEENCLELHENGMVEEKSLKSGEYANQQQPEKSKEEPWKKGAKGIFSRLASDEELSGGARRWIENEQKIAPTGETSSGKRRCQTTSAKENYDPGKIGAPLKSFAMKRSYGEEKKKRY